jgi:choice-of-anchor B domain-containing protein
MRKLARGVIPRPRIRDRGRDGVVAGWVLLAGAPAVHSQSWNVELLARATQGAGRDVYAACWGWSAPDGTELALIGTVDGTDIFDVTSPREVLQVGSIPGPRSRWREMQTWSHYAYIVTEGGPAAGERGGMQIVDLSVPRSPRLVGSFDSTFVTAHTIHIAAGFAYVNGTGNGMRILDLADPERPRDVGGWGGRYVHDCWVRGDIGYMANINNGGFTVLDLADRSHPRELAFTSYPGGATHNCWGSADGNYLFTTDEVAGGHLHVWDVRDPATPLPVAEWSATSGSASIHNVVVRGDSAYIAYYTEGLQVLDISNPASPQLVGYYDTYPGVSGLFDGNWGVYPLAKNGNIYLSDITSGLFVVRMVPEGEPLVDFRLDAPSGQTAVPGQGPVWFWYDLYNTAGGSRVYELSVAAQPSWPVSVQPQVTVPRNGVEAVLVTVEVPAQLAGPVRVDVELCARSTSTRLEQCAVSRLAVPVALQEFAARSTGSEVLLRWELGEDPGGDGGLRIDRRPDGPADGSWVERVRLDLAARSWTDVQVQPGAAYVYRLVLADSQGEHVLGERAVEVLSPSRSTLAGSWPNPSRSQTGIHFALARGGDVALSIFDVRGRHVRELASPGARPGPHAIVWDGRDAGGRALPSGVYLYEVRSGGWSARGRVTLAR